MNYYSIYIPTKNETEVNDKCYVFTEIEEALKVLKTNKDGRLKVFKSNDEAENYAQTGWEDYQPKLSHLKSPSTLVEKAVFRAPTKQELVMFRKTIEEGNYERVKTIIWENPRYLVNSGDTPTTLKEGTRYNALHLCALHNKAQIAELLLQTISTTAFVELLHGKKNIKICEEVCEILLDYYLNMPEKGRSETPLHLAAKYGAIEVIEVLITYPQCKMTFNLENLLPKDIICSRVADPSAELIGKISSLLDERFYVPVIRSIDNSVPPVIGEPFSPTNPPDYYTKEFKKDPKSPELEIQAYAGPMSKEQAQSFRRRWKTPPRTGNSSVSPIINSSHISPLRSSTPGKSINNNASPLAFAKKIIFSKKNNVEDSANGNIPNGDNLVLENNNSDLRPHMLTLTPLRKNPLKKNLFISYRDKAASPFGFESDNDSVSSINSDIPERDACDSVGWQERHLKLIDTEKGLELIGRELAKEQKVQWKEYWDFLDCFVDISSQKGLDKLESHLGKRKKAQEDEARKSNFQTKKECIMNELCSALDQLGFCKDRVDFSEQYAQQKAKENQSDNSHSTTPYLCVEKSLQVYARRMTNTIIHNIESVLSINDALNSELKRLKSLICSFKDDIRFVSVDFSVVHSRFARLIADYFKKQNSEIDIEKVKSNFIQILDSIHKSEKAKNRSNEKNDSQDCSKEQLRCACKFILDCLQNVKEFQFSENSNTEEVCEAFWKSENVCSCTWNSKLRQSNRKRRLELRDVPKAFLDYDDAAVQTEIGGQNITQEADISKTETNTETVSDFNDGEEDIFWSDVGSESGDERFYTPPESPSVLECNLLNESLEGYNIYLLGTEPTKRDIDVLNALLNVEIDKIQYPNIYYWKAAVMRYPLEERDNLLSPIPPVTAKARPQPQRKEDATLVPKRLFTSPRPSPPIIHIGDYHNHTADRINKDSPLNLSFMNVSDL